MTSRNPVVEIFNYFDFILEDIKSISEKTHFIIYFASGIIIANLFLAFVFVFPSMLVFKILAGLWFIGSIVCFVLSRRVQDGQEDSKKYS